MNDHNYKLDTFLYNKIKDISNIKILEFGVRKGVSTKLFVDLAEKNNGQVTSVDIDNYSSLINSERWKFIQTRDDNYEKIQKELSNDLDVILLDSFHEAEHVSKIIYTYYKHLKKGGYFFIDDVSWVPYLKNSYRDNFWCEVNNKETFTKIVNIYSENYLNFDLEFTFISSGFAAIKKKTLNDLNQVDIKKDRSLSVKNLLRLIKKKIKIEK